MKFVVSIITVYLPKSNEIVKPESIHQAPSILQYRIFHDDGRPRSFSHSIVQKSK